MKLNARVAIVTGAGSGIGKTTAQLLAEQGASVVVVDCNRDAGEQVAAEIVAGGRTAIFCYADVSRELDVQNMVQCALENFAGVDVLVNNAAIQIMAKLVDTSEADWNSVHNVNLKGVFLGCKHAIPAMIRRGGGSIINVASVLGFVGDPDLAAYCAAKGGVIALTRVAALTYGPQRVRVNCICPGDVETPMVQAYFEAGPDPAALKKTIFEKYALRRIAAPSEVAQTIAFLASEESSFITGSSLVIDGGLTVKCY
jgi:meso-butanediol dehydrogenase/(S,S)-butanediol dehydrogenase/diacetyl reductase